MSYKKWIHKYNYLQCELDEITAQHDEYLQQFAKDFITKTELEENKKELVNKESGIPDIDIELELTGSKEVPNKTLKQLYKSLSKHAHPDAGGTDKDFQEVSILYSENDTLGLLDKAIQYNIPIDNFVTDEMIETFEDQCKRIHSKIEGIKETAAWEWCTGTNERKEFLSEYLEKVHGIRRR